VKTPWVVLAPAFLLFIISPSDNAISQPKQAPRVMNVRAVEPGPKERFYLQPQTANEDEVIALFHALIDRGAEKVNLFPSNIIACELPLGADRTSYFSDPGVVVMADREVGPHLAAGAQAALYEVKKCYELAERVASGEAPPPGDDGFNDLVLTVPREAVHDRIDDQGTVRVLRDGRIREKRITLGPENRDMLVVTAGLDEGAMVVLGK